MKAFKWSYGVTTVDKRLESHLPQTLKSLKQGGFPDPVLFIDGLSKPPPVTLAPVIRSPKIGAFGNWSLALNELFLRSPNADFFAIFQDDILASMNLRRYLEKCPFPKKGYYNLFTYPHNEGREGWHLSDQMGKGALGLVFDVEGVKTILTSKTFINHPILNNTTARIDGCVVDVMKENGWREWVHSPSLLQHTGDQTTIGNQKPIRVAESFKGEEFDSMKLVASTKINDGTIGLIGYNCRMGLGELNRQLAEYEIVNTWMVKDHSTRQTLPNHPKVITIKGPSNMEDFIKSVSTLLFAETPCDQTVTGLAKKHGRKVVCVPMIEWFEGTEKWANDVDLFICPTQQCYNLLKDSFPCKLFPWPVDTKRYKQTVRSRVSRFLFVDGYGGWSGRKGSETVREALRLWPDMPITVRSQRAEGWPFGVDVRRESDENSSLYIDGDILICPHAVDGLGLETMEAMASGMPVIVPNGEPWLESPHIAKILTTVTKKKIKREMDWHKMDTRHLIDVCRSLLGKDIKQKSEDCITWANERSWSKLREEFLSLIHS